MRPADSHCHIQMAQFDDDREDAIARALDALEFIVVIGIEPESIAQALSLTRGRVYAAIGYHPYHEDLASPEGIERLRDWAAHGHVVAIGEMGLDYYKHCSIPRDVQAAGFVRQLELAADLQKPVVIHNREADADCHAILKEHAEHVPDIIIHCFGSGPAFAEQCLEIGCHISFAGNLTYPKAAELREAAKVVPMDRLLVETDAPYLAPQPRRGKRNEPAYTTFTCETLAEIKGVSFGDMATATTRNAMRVFGV